MFYIEVLFGEDLRRNCQYIRRKKPKYLNQW